MSTAIQRRGRPGLATLIEKFPLILFLALLVWLSVQSPYFLSWQNISLMLVQSVPLAILCFGLVCVIAVGGDDVVSGGIDLSLPATAVLGVALLSLGLAEWHTPYLLLLALLAAVCLLCGAINGLLVLAAGLPPLLATLSTSVAFTGLTDLLTSQRRIAVSDPLMVAFRDNSVLDLPWPLVYLLGVFILFQFLLHHSRFGQHVQAVGGNRDMAQMSGLNVCRCSARAPAAPAGRPRRCCWRPCWRPLSAPPSRAVGWSPFGGRCWGQSWSTPSLTGSACWGSISSGWAPLKAA